LAILDGPIPARANINIRINVSTFSGIGCRVSGSSLDGHREANRSFFWAFICFSLHALPTLKLLVDDASSFWYRRSTSLSKHAESLLSQVAGGLIKAPKISYGKASRLYG
jgi:hypothetical protein